MSNNNLKNSDLKKSIEKLISDPTKKSENSFFQLLKSNKLLIPVNKQRDSGENLDIQIQSLSSPDNEKFIPLFLSWEDMNSFQVLKDSDGLVVSYQTYRDLITNKIIWNGVVINPNSFNIILKTADFQFIDNNIIKSGDTLYFGEPAKPPLKLMDKLTEFFQKDNSISKAFIIQTVRGKESPILMLVLETNNFQKVLPKIQSIASLSLANQVPIDIVPLDSDTSKSMIKGIKPFFIKV